MEFEWQHRQPGDASSGFHQVALQHENKKRAPFIPPLPSISFRSIPCAFAFDPELC
jgi:hypothetical protein